MFLYPLHDTHTTPPYSGTIAAKPLPCLCFNTSRYWKPFMFQRTLWTALLKPPSKTAKICLRVSYPKLVPGPWMGLNHFNSFYTWYPFKYLSKPILSFLNLLISSTYTNFFFKTQLRIQFVSEGFSFPSPNTPRAHHNFCAASPRCVPLIPLYSK